MTDFLERARGFLAAAIIAMLPAAPALAGVTIYEEGDKKVEIGARIQIQYALVSPDDGDSSDRLFFRRLRPYIMGTVYKNWIGKIAFDFGESLDADEVAVKDAYMLYTGAGKNKMYIGNSKTPFSREFLTSSKRLDLVGRSFSGDHNFGTPDRMLGYKNDGQAKDKHLTWSVAAGAEQHDPGMNRMDFDTPVNNRLDWNEGALVAGRIDVHPRGYVAFSQGDFDRDEWKYTIGFGSFYWINDDDNNTYTLPDGSQDPASPETPDLDNAVGVELSGALRGHGLSVDVEIQQVSAETVVSDFTGGLYLNGKTDLDKLGIQAGYMFVKKYEVVFGWSQLDADNYSKAWSRTEIGFNYYLNQHNLKVQANYGIGQNVFGVDGDDANTLQIQTQFVF